MTSNMRCLLQLPPSLRQACFLAERFSTVSGIGRQHVQIRTFTCTRFLPQKAPPKPMRKPVAPSAQTNASTTRTRPAPVSTTRPVLSGAPSRPPPPSTATLVQKAGPLDAEQVLLYTAPNHGGFFATSFFAAASFLAGAAFTALNGLKDEPGRPKIPWYIKAAEGLPALFLAAMGTACALAPLKIIKSMTIIGAHGQRLLRFEIKRPLPFMKPDVLEAKFSEVNINRAVRSFTGDIKMNNINITQAESFTSNYFSKSSQTRSKRGVMSALLGFNKSLLHAWPSLQWNVRRMLLREGMAYVRIGKQGLFKLDVHECSLLDLGKPMEVMIRTEPKGRPSITNWARTLVGR